MRKQLDFERLEDRRYLSYDLQVVAETGAPNSGFQITGFFEAPSINDAGVVAFVAQQPGGEGIFTASGNPSTLRRLEGSSPNRSIGTAATIDNEGEVAATLRLDQDLFNPISYRVKKYPSDVTIASAGRNGDPFPSGSRIQDYVGLGFDPSQEDPRRSIVFAVNEAQDNKATGRVNIWESIDGVSRQITGSVTREIIPAVADDGAFVVQTETPSNEPIILYEPRFDVSGKFSGADDFFIAGTSRFSDLGAAPGISDDSVVVFYGVLTEAGAKLISDAQPGLDPLNPGSGIFVSSDHNGRVIQRIAGISGNAWLEPGESWHDANGDGDFDAGEDVGGFSQIDADSPLNIETRSLNIQTRSAVAQVAFVATSTDGLKGIYVHEFAIAANGAVNRTDVTKDQVVQQGDMILGVDAPVDDLRSYRGLNRLGVVAFIAEFEDGKSAIIKAVPDPAAVLNVVTHGFGNKVDDLGIDPSQITVFPDFLSTWTDLGQTPGQSHHNMRVLRPLAD